MPRQISEERTRKEMINPQLEFAGWYLRDHSRVKIEIRACPEALFGVDGYDAVEWGDGLLPPAAAKMGKCLRLLKPSGPQPMSVSRKLNSHITSLKLKSTNHFARLDFSQMDIIFMWRKPLPMAHLHPVRAGSPPGRDGLAHTCPACRCRGVQMNAKRCSSWQ